jgi:hypothetical protein
MKRIFTEARDQFVSALGDLRGQLEKSFSPESEIQIEHIALDFIGDNPPHQDHSKPAARLCTDIAILRSVPKATTGFPNQATREIKNRNICFVTSGIHGIEGYAGSALQSLLLGQIDFIKSTLATTDLCFIHAANPWGMHNFERTDQHNVDLNRNCHTDPRRYNQQNTPLAALRTLTAPKEPLRWRSVEIPSLSGLSFSVESARSLQFYARLIGLFLRKGIKSSTLAVVNGQYEYADEIFYGGKKLNSHLSSLQQVLVDNLCTNTESRSPREQQHCYEQCTVIDIHTGLGRKGGLTLLLDEQSLLNSSTWKTKFREFKTQYESRNWPVTPGIFSDWLCELVLPQKTQQHAAIVFEIGTFGNGSVASNLESLKRMVEANQLRQFGTLGRQDLAVMGEKAIRRRFRELFLPEDPAWEHDVVNHRSQDLQNLIAVIVSQN